MERHGFIRSELELKTLILFALRCAACPVAFDNLSDMVLRDEAIDYFEYINALNDLVKTEHIHRENKDGAELYFISKKGIKNLDICVNNLAVSVREHTKKAVEYIMHKERRKADIDAHMVEHEDGSLSVICKLRDDSGEIMSLELSVITYEQGQSIINSFENNAENIYNTILSAML
ncbi:MAG: DUF4364 family protein [Clostridia bacterium]|nr:DUF4364 family protein [Clostridia bacterium]